MLKIFRKYFKFVSFRLLILLLILLFVFGYYRKESKVARAFNNRINIFPSAYKLENSNWVVVYRPLNSPLF